MVAIIRIGKEEKEAHPGMTIESVMISMKMYPDSFLYLLNGVPIPMDTLIEDGMVIKALKVASGG
jgi:sulfur carrier protein